MTSPQEPNELSIRANGLKSKTVRRIKWIECVVSVGFSVKVLQGLRHDVKASRIMS